MSLDDPRWLFALGLLVPVAIAFLVRRRQTLIRVPSTALWRSAGVVRTRSRKLRNIVRLVCLLLCLTGVALLCLAAARPLGSARVETTAVVVDVSASMGSGERASPLGKARSILRGLLARRGPGDRFAILAAGSAPRVLAAPTTDAALLERALERLAPERGSSDTEAALELAAGLVAGAPGARVLLLHDGAPVDTGQIVARNLTLSAQALSFEHTDNLGITALGTRPPDDAQSESERELLLAVATSSTAARRATVRIEADGVELASRTLDLAPRSEVELRLRLRIDAQKLVARVAPADRISDALDSDDEARLDASAPRELRVVLVSGASTPEASSFFVEQALKSAAGVQVVREPPERAAAAAKDADVIVVLDRAPPKLPAVPALFLGTRDGPLPVPGVRALSQDGGGTRLRSVDARHPLMRGVVLDGTALESALAVEPPRGTKPLVELDGGVVALTGGAGRTQWLYVGIDPTRSDLVLRVAFPVLVANTIALFSGSSRIAVAKTVPRSEVSLERARETAWLAPLPAMSRGLPAAPWVLVALAAAALLGAELVLYKRGFST